MRLVWFTYALKQTMLVIWNFHVNKDSFLFVDIRFIDVDHLDYSLNVNMVLIHSQKQVVRTLSVEGTELWQITPHPPTYNTT